MSGLVCCVFVVVFLALGDASQFNAGNFSCIHDLALNERTNGTTSSDCVYRVNLDGHSDRLWSLELLSEQAVTQVVVLDEKLVALVTLFSSSQHGAALQETMCRRSSGGVLESVFYLVPLGGVGIHFSLEAFLLPNSRLTLGVPVTDVIASNPHFFYFLVPSDLLLKGRPLSVDVASPEGPNTAPYQLQVSWNGCPDMNLRDSEHHVLSFVSQGRMLILASQFGDTLPDVLYVGVRPRPRAGFTPVNTTADLPKQLKITVSFGDTFVTSSVAITQWALMLVALIIFVLVALGVSFLMLKPGVKRLRASAPRSADLRLADRSDSDLRLGDRRTRGRAKAYLWMIVLAGLFYLLPSLQTAGASASGMLTSGNRDTCFYNEQCMFPLQTGGPYGVIWFAGNNVISNTVYILMALAIFSWTMFCKWHWAERTVVLRVVSLPHDYTLFYCLAVALFYEGLMSATYHVCPTRLLFTIDTTYMFVGSILISLEVYRKWFRQLPHPMFPFCLLTSLMVFNFFGTFLDIYNVEDLVLPQPDMVSRVLWVVIFIVLWCAVVVVISIRHRKRMNSKVLIFMMAANCLFGFLPVFSFLDFALTDRSSLLLGVALLSAIFNLFAYVLGTMNRVDLATKIFRALLGVMIFALAVPAIFSFSKSPSDKAMTPWASRDMNEPCVVSGFFDEHDQWHVLSALALAATMFLLMHTGEQAHDPSSSVTEVSGDNEVLPTSKNNIVITKSDESTPLL